MANTRLESDQLRSVSSQHAFVDRHGHTLFLSIVVLPGDRLGLAAIWATGLVKPLNNPELDE
jgi:hypothetical protein